MLLHCWKNTYINTVGKYSILSIHIFNFLLIDKGRCLFVYIRDFNTLNSPFIDYLQSTKYPRVKTKEFLSTLKLIELTGKHFCFGFIWTAELVNPHEESFFFFNLGSSLMLSHLEHIQQWKWSRSVLLLWLNYRDSWSHFFNPIDT